MRRFFSFILILAVIGAGVAWWITAPNTADASVLAGVEGDAAQGELVFYAAGCASCHASEEATGEDKLILAGGQAFKSPFGTFYAPNISTDPEHGIGGWSDIEFYNAMVNGVSPDGAHYFPAFPYTSYNKATVEDVAALYAFMQTLPADATPSKAHDVGFPFNIRRSVGGWKFLFLNDDWVVTTDLTEVEERGRYLSEALGHCGECHTPRSGLGALQYGDWLAGGPNPSGEGNIPNITPAKLTWNDLDLVSYFETGFTPEFDSAGGHMAAVIENLAKLPVEDREAIVAYLRKVAPVE